MAIVGMLMGMLRRVVVKGVGGEKSGHHGGMIAAMAVVLMLVCTASDTVMDKLAAMVVMVLLVMVVMVVAVIAVTVKRVQGC